MNRTEILKGIIAKGGIIGAAAKMYLNDRESTDDFIRECYHQCHNASARKMWGEQLVSAIENHVLFGDIAKLRILRKRKLQRIPPTKYILTGNLLQYSFAE